MEGFRIDLKTFLGLTMPNGALLKTHLLAAAVCQLFCGRVDEPLFGFRTPEFYY